MKPDRYTRYLTRLGFTVSKVIETQKPEALRAYKYSSFDARRVRSTLGKARKFKEGRFVFVLARGRAVRVDTARKQILLGNSPKLVTAFLNSVPD